MPAFSALFLAFLASAPAWARSVPDHPVLEGILNQYEGKLQPGSCRTLVDGAFQKIAAVEKLESAVLLKDFQGGGCRLDFVAAGGKDYVTRDLDLYNALLNDPKAESAFDLHVHPLANSDFFRAGGAYSGEIMFASETTVRELALPADQYDALLAKMQAGVVPGFNLSPPSIQDLMVASSEENLPLQYVVITSGGAWTYSFDEGADKADLFKRIDDLKAYSFMYLAATTEGGDPARKQRGQSLFDLNMQDPATKQLVTEWQACSLALRKPYSAAAVAALLAGNPQKARAEFQEKLAFAARWSVLMKSIGFTMDFKPF
jgi:hypothetical protein